MGTTVATAPTAPSAVHEKFSKGPGFVGTLIFIGVLVVGISYIGWSISRDLANLHVTSLLPYFLLGLALFVALGFEFVNGFHDTANAVATVIYTHTLDPHIAVVWSGFFDFLGVVTSTGIVAFGIISLVAGGIDSAGRQQRRIRHGFCLARCRDSVEPRHLVFRLARF